MEGEVVLAVWSVEDKVVLAVWSVEDKVVLAVWSVEDKVVLAVWSVEDEGQRAVDGGVVRMLAVLHADVDAGVASAVEGPACVHHLQTSNSHTVTALTTG